VTPDLVLVTYRDAHFDFDGPTERSDYLVRVVGWIVEDGPLFLSIGSERLPDGDGFRAITHIPKTDGVYPRIEQLYPSRHPHPDPLG
jgi:hypothetical protein